MQMHMTSESAQSKTWSGIANMLRLLVLDCCTTDQRTRENLSMCWRILPVIPSVFSSSRTRDKRTQAAVRSSALPREGVATPFAKHEEPDAVVGLKMAAGHRVNDACPLDVGRMLLRRVGGLRWLTPYSQVPQHDGDHA